MRWLLLLGRFSQIQDNELREANNQSGRVVFLKMKFGQNFKGREVRTRRKLSPSSAMGPTEYDFGFLGAAGDNVPRTGGGEGQSYQTPKTEEGLKLPTDFKAVQQGLSQIGERRRLAQKAKTWLSVSMIKLTYVFLLLALVGCAGPSTTSGSSGYPSQDGLKEQPLEDGKVAKSSVQTREITVTPAQEKVSVDGLTLGMRSEAVAEVKGEPDTHSRYSPHAYVVYSSQPLFSDEEAWTFQSPKGETVLLFKSGVLRSVRGPSLEWQGQSYQDVDWPKVASTLETAFPNLSIGYTEVPKVRGFYLSDLSAAEHELRMKRYDRVSGKHHFDTKGDIFRGQKGQTCQTCKANQKL